LAGKSSAKIPCKVLFKKQQGDFGKFRRAKIHRNCDKTAPLGDLGQIRLNQKAPQNHWTAVEAGWYSVIE